MALLLFVFLPVEYGLSLSGETLGISSERLLFLLPVTAVSLLLPVLPLLLGGGAWKLAITNRRFLHRPDIWGSTIEEIPIAGIEDVDTLPDGDGLIVRGGGKQLVISADRNDCARILATLGRG